jgi:hypothetical protein
MLGDGLEKLLGMGVVTLEGFVDGLNDMNIRGPSAEKWTTTLLAEEMRRLGE